ncbi:MAG: collagenase-like protease, partial [Marinilabiliales bacterium]
THNAGQIKFLNQLNARQVNLSRELNIKEITALSNVGKELNIQIEVFIHGSYCISFSGICYMSSLQGGNSGNRGRCSQPCREKYIQTPEGKEYPLNLKDNSAYYNLPELTKAGVNYFKIEGRIKEFDYVYTVVKAWKAQIKHFFKTNTLIDDNSDLYKVFNRDFSNGFLTGDISKNMFIDDPMSYSTKYLSKVNDYNNEKHLIEDQKNHLKQKEQLRKKIQQEISRYNTNKIPLDIRISGEVNQALEILVKSPENTVKIVSDIVLSETGKEAITLKIIMNRLNAINNTEYYIENVDNKLAEDLFLPFKELSAMKRRILYILNASKDFIAPVKIPKIGRDDEQIENRTLSVLISSKEDINLCKDPSISYYFRLPDCIQSREDEFLEFFTKNKFLKPWFPSILMGDDYKAASDFLKRLNPEICVTNNTGIALEACNLNIPWIAGPFLNTTNSYSLICLKEKFNCNGSFISNEISKNQIKSIKKPKNFKLYYSIFHPIHLMTSRQCLFQQVKGCGKKRMDNSCIIECKELSYITNLKGDRFYLEKSQGNHHRLYNASNLLNTNIVEDFPDLFTSFFISFESIATETVIPENKPEVIQYFKNYINGNTDAATHLIETISHVNNTQYITGI